ncbi:MAG: hypothetical protein JXA89_23285 [Anaerolineae bacterium]|nr:hypothetical protein [Anaerolineae bacterium]
MLEPPTDKRAAIRDFAIAFLDAFGATIESAGGDELVVHLPPDLADHFGKKSLHLVFSAVEMSPFEDLVVYGSRTFEKMASWLENRGEMAALHLPRQVAEPAGRKTPPVPLTLVNVNANVQSRAGSRPYALFNLLLTYTADDRSEELLTLVLDENGDLHPELSQAHRDAVEWPQQTLPLPAKVFNTLAQRAVEHARAHAEERAAAIEAKNELHREKSLERLRSFYDRRIQDIEPQNPEDKAIQQMLREELARKVADEVERYRVQVTISPVSLAVLAVPYQHYKLALERPNGLSAALSLEQNMHDGTLTAIHCYACHESTTHLGLCDHGHIVCGSCLHTCAACHQDVCEACNIVPDRINGDWVCAECAITCSGCQNTFLPAHTAPCAHCGELFCDTCLETCPHCGKRFCTGHMVACTTCGTRRCIDQGLRCEKEDHPVCEAHHATCPICGDGHCPTHGTTCAICQQTVCQGCINTEGICRTCVQAMHNPPLSWPELAGRTTWEAAYNWQVAQNRAWRVYYGEKGRGIVHTWAVIVVDVNNEAILYQHRQSVLDGVVARLTRSKTGK